MKKFIKNPKGFTTFSFHERGFTLIELLVVITIIAVLATIGFVAYSGVTARARDATRQADLRTIQTALEQYFADQLFYPHSNVASSTPAGLNLSSIFPLTSLIGNPAPSPSPAPTKIYITTIPTDPKSPPGYCYQALPEDCDNTSANKCTSYYLYAKLENTEGSIPDNADTCNGIRTYNYYNYRLAPP